MRRLVSLSHLSTRSSRHLTALMLGLGVLAPALSAQQVTATRVPLPERSGKGFLFAGNQAVTVSLESDPQFGMMLLKTGLLQVLAHEVTRANSRQGSCSGRTGTSCAKLSDETWSMIAAEPESHLSQRVNATLSGFSLDASGTPWRRQVVATERAVGERRVMSRIDASRDRIYVGAGPLTAMNTKNGEILWALAADSVGTVDLGRSQIRADGSLLAVGDDGRVQLIDGATGRRIWSVKRAPAVRSLNNQVTPQFSVIDWDGGNVLMIGRTLELFDPVAGKTIWTTEEDIGFLMEIFPGDLAVFQKDKQLIGRSTVDGRKLWTFDAKTQVQSVSLADLTSAATSDLIAFTNRGVDQVDRSTGVSAWHKYYIDDSNFGSLIATPFVIIPSMDLIWDGLNASTGQRAWRFAFSGMGGRDRHIDPALSASLTGTVLFVAAAEGNKPPYSLTGVDLMTGKQIWRTAKVTDAVITDYDVIDSTRIVVSNNGRVLGALDAKTGALLTPETDVGADAGTWTLNYNARRKLLTCVTPTGAVAWTRSGEQSWNAPATLLTAQNAVVWTQTNGAVEIVALASGKTLNTTQGVAGRRITVDPATGRVLVPQEGQLQLLTVTR